MNFFQRLFKKREEKIFRPATQEEIDALEYYNWIHMTSGIKVAKMEDILKNEEILEDIKMLEE